MLKDQIDGKINSWAIRWHASLFINNKFCLHPTKSIVQNIGFDNSATHTSNLSLRQNPIDFINLNRIEIKEASWFFEEYKTQFIKKKSLWSKILRRK